MKQAASEILAALALAVVLGGINDENPYQNLCLALAAIFAIASIQLGRKR